MARKHVGHIRVDLLENCSTTVGIADILKTSDADNMQVSMHATRASKFFFSRAP